ncbi:SRPBCC family protein [Mesorhizobium sp. ArgA1]
MYDHVIWPERHDPGTSALYALNDIGVKAPPEVVWRLLVDAENWSSHFPTEDQVKVLTGEPKLALGTKYSPGIVSNDQNGHDHQQPRQGHLHC